MNGMFLGPARVLCTETQRDPDGQLQPGASIWCVRGRWSTLSEEDQQNTEEGMVFWADEGNAIEIVIPMPETRKGRQTAIRDLEAYFLGMMKRRAVEVVESRLSPEERKQFDEAKSIEVNNYLAARAFQTLRPDQKPSPDQVIGMRWILTWKLKDDGAQKRKARAILKGYQDPKYEFRATTTPVMTRQTRQLMLHTAAQQRWSVKKGREYPAPLYCLPCKEITDAMGLSEPEVCQVKRGCYGLVDAAGMVPNNFLIPE